MTRITRRAFLSTAAALLPVGALTATAAPKENILIIGAGIAGIAAAQALGEQGYAVTILEARDRIGGRINTDTSLGFPADLGASWLHGPLDNPVTELLQKNNIRTQLWDTDETDVYLQGKPLAEEEWDKVEAIGRQIRRDLRSRKKDALPNESLQKAVDELLQQHAPEPLRPYARYWIYSEIEQNYGNPLDELSLPGYDEDKEFRGGDYSIPGGYGQLTTALAKGLSVKLRQQVTRIEVQSDQVHVTTKTDRFTADRCIVTLPLGVLAANQVTFIPELPQSKKQGIQRLGKGSFLKVFLLFDDVFWPKKAGLLGSAVEPRAEFVNLLPSVDKPALVMLVCGAFARKLEAMTDAEATTAATDKLSKMLDKTIPRPKKTLISRWGKDPFTRGTYSSLAPGSQPSDFDTLAEPIGNRLFFAGEATSRTYFGTVHGALLSGRRAAEEIQKAT